MQDRGHRLDRADNDIDLAHLGEELRPDRIHVLDQARELTGGMALHDASHRSEPTPGVPALARSRWNEAPPSANQRSFAICTASFMPAKRRSSTCAPVVAIAEAAALTACHRFGVGVTMPLSVKKRTRSWPTLTSSGRPERDGHDVRVQPVHSIDQGRASMRSSTYRAMGPSCVQDSMTPCSRSRGRYEGRAPSRLEPDDPAVVGRVADAVPGVASDIEWRAAGGDECGGAAAAAARSTGEIVRIRCAAVDEVVRFVSEGELRCIRAAEEDRTGRADAADGGAVLCGDAFRPPGGAGGRDHAGDFVRVFRGEGNAVQGTQILPRASAALASRAACRAASAVERTSALIFGLTTAMRR